MTSKSTSNCFILSIVDSSKLQINIHDPNRNKTDLLKLRDLNMRYIKDFVYKFYTYSFIDGKGKESL